MALAAVMPSVMHAAQIDVVATQTIVDLSPTGFGANVRQINVDTTWTKDNIYILTDKVFVTNGATLTIEAGTKIYSTLDVNGAGTTDDQFGSLAITRGSNIIAAGTADEPIVFTTTDELEAETQTDIDGDSFVADAPTPATAGRWGGVVILGSAPIVNNISGVDEGRIEGFQPAESNDVDGDGRADVIEYGGEDAADNSGVFQYVSIRHGGFVFSGANEINGLTLGGVGNGTTIDHIEVFANKDDGIEFFGGTVNTSHILLAFNQDDGFDIDEGYSGTNQFWFGVQDPFEIDGVTSGHDNGGEWDGYTGGNTGTDLTSGSAPIIYNATFIGSGTGALAGNDKGNNAIFIEDRFRGLIYNSVFDDFQRDIVGSASDGPGTGLFFAHNTVGRFGGGTPGNNLSYVSDSGAANTFYDGSGTPINGNSAGGVNPLYTDYSRDGSNFLEVINPLPAAGSPLLTVNGATLQAGAPVATTYRGAFGNTNWAAGWTKFDNAGFFTKKIDVVAEQTIVDVSPTGLGANVRQINVDTTWFKENIYILTDKVFVTNGATLTIEAGTKIYSTLDVKGAGTTDDEFGSLAITRGSNIIAAGTADEPIVFTTIDELEAETQTDIDGDGFIAEAPGTSTAGRWGGVVILGSAPIVNNISGVDEGRIEGFQPAESNDVDGDGRADVIEYGGEDAADNSGVFQYVSIRHGGFVFSGANEINGLTLGGVGNGTTIDHIEVFANKDDGIEFFGGTVNTSHIVLAFNQDDGFDIDEGYSGTNQFWFGIQGPFEIDGVTSGHDNGGEWDGYTGGNTGSDLTSGSAPIIYNATFIGSGTGALAGNDKGNNAIFIEDRFRGKIYNSVFDDFQRDLIGSASDGPGTGLEFRFNTIGRFGGGAYTGTNASNLSFVSDAGAANTVFNAAGAPINGNSNGGVNPMYKEYTRDGSNELLAIDPRPAAGSPLWVASSNLQSGAPVATTYRGAFGSENWAAGWTKLSFSGILEGEAAVAGSAPFTDVDGDGISDTLEGTTALTNLGFSASVNNVSNHGNVQGTNLFNSLASPAQLLEIGYFANTIDTQTGDAVLTLKLEGSTTLSNWMFEQDVNVGLPNGTKFYRFTDGN